MSGPVPLADHGVGDPCVPGTPVEVAPRVVRLTAPNPSMMTGPGTNTYVVGDDRVLVVDPGPLDEGHEAAVLELVGTRPVTAVAVTHHHRDHAPAARSLASRVGAPVVGHGHEACRVDVRAAEGTVLEAGGVALVAWHTPGHASDHLCYLVEGEGLLLTGDHVMQGSTVVVRPPDGDLAAYLASLARVRDDPRVRRLAPGHGQLLDDPAAVVEEILEHRAQRGALVLGALREHGPARAAELRPFAYPDVGPERDEVATATCWAHLLALAADGRATSSSTRADPEAVFTATP